MRALMPLAAEIEMLSMIDSAERECSRDAEPRNFDKLL
jgi:hypothetical protein